MSPPLNISILVVILYGNLDHIEPPFYIIVLKLHANIDNTVNEINVPVRLKVGVNSPGKESKATNVLRNRPILSPGTSETLLFHIWELLAASEILAFHARAHWPALNALCSKWLL